MDKLELFRVKQNFQKRIFGCVCGAADVPLTPCRRAADVPLALSLTLSFQKALHALYSGGSVS